MKIQMNSNKFTKLSTLLALFIYKTIINELITCYIYLKNTVELIQKIYNNRHNILIFNYKKLCLKIIIEIRNSIEENLKVIYPLVEYFIYKYILNHSFFKICFNYIYKSNYKDLKLHVFNKLDILVIYKNKLKAIFSFIYILILYIKEKSKKNFDEFEFFLNNIQIIKISNFYTVLEKITKSLDVKLIKLQPLKEELKFFKNIFNKNCDKYILFENIN